MTERVESQATLDTFGRLCPIPIYMTAKAIQDLDIGQVLEVLSDDEAIVKDMPAWCHEVGHEIVHWSAENDGTYHHFIRREV